VSDMLRELCIMSVICAIACSLSPEGPVKRLLGVCCSVILMLTALKPVGEFDIENFAGFQAKYRELESFLHEDTEIISSSLNRLVIEEEYRTYIMDKAEKEGIEISQISLELDWHPEGFWMPSEVCLMSEEEAEKLTEFSLILVSEFGISEDRIIWERPA